MIIGSCGAGKSTLAHKVQEKTGLELLHLDQHYWQPGWVEPTKEDWEAKVRQLVAKIPGLLMEITLAQCT